MPNPMNTASITGAAFMLSPIGQAVAGLYGIASSFNDFLNRHIDEMKGSGNPTVERTGRILEMAKYGFGIGYLSSVTIIAVGQMLLGNTLAAASTVATAAALSNPIAMTCAAVGAILYGWGALRDDERNGILDTLAKGLEIGVELIKAVVAFVIRTADDLFGSKRLKEFKGYITDKAALFGHSLSDVTRLTADVITDAASSVRKHASEAMTTTAKAASEATDRVGSTLSELGKAAGQAFDQTSAAAQQALDSGKEAIRKVRGDRADDGESQPK